MHLADRIVNMFPTEKEIPEAFRVARPLVQREYLIQGEIRTWEGPLEDVRSCIALRGESGPGVLGSFPALTPRQSEEALDAACKAYDCGSGRWPTLSVADRIRHVEEFVGRMKEKRDEIVNLLMWEIGKTLEDSRKEFDRTMEYILRTIDALKDLDRVSSRFSIEEGIIGQIRRAPLGVVLCMGPYNYPLNETFTTLIPALIMGNTVILKPPKIGVLLHRPLLEAYRDSFPPGVVNTITGDGAVIIGPLMKSGRVDCLAFIGSSKVADLLKLQHPTPHRLRTVLGLGAKNPAILLEDADLDLAVQECVLGSLSYNGQRCTALKILFVHRSRVDVFVERLSHAVNAMPPGMPWEDGVKITPLPEPGKPEKMKEWVDEAVKAGASVMNSCGGMIHGNYYHPAVVCPVAPGTRLYSEEQFGPVVPVVPYEDVQEPVRYVRESKYGQQVAIFGQDPKKIARLMDPLVNQVCRVNINSQCQRGPDSFPFTGRKDSAEGTLSITDALRVFSIRTLVAAKDKPANKEILSTIVRERHSNFLNTDFIL